MGFLLGARTGVLLWVRVICWLVMLGVVVATLKVGWISRRGLGGGVGLGVDAHLGAETGLPGEGNLEWVIKVWVRQSSLMSVVYLHWEH